MAQTDEQIKALKKEFRSLMNGVLSSSMREKGLTYRVIFGVELGRLHELADSMEQDHALAQALWKEDIRECRILSAMLQPSDSFYPEIADIWIESMRFQEEAELTVMNLFQRLPYASESAFRWIADEREMFQTCGFLLLGRLFSNGATLNEDSRGEFLDQAAAALKSNSSMVKRAAVTSLRKFMDLGQAEEKAGEELLG